MVQRNIDYRLYLVTDRYDYSDDKFLAIIATACANGVTLVELREKSVSSRRYFELAVAVKQVTDRYDVPLIIDDRVDICLAVGADGVHVGDSDLPVDVVRQLIGPDRILGVSVKDTTQAKEALAQGADYFGTGAIYPTKTKVITKHTSLATLQAIAQEVPIPVNAIGGIKTHNITNLAGTGIAGVCVVSEIMQAADVASKVRQLRRAVEMLV